MARKSWWNDRYVPASRPRQAQGGIKSQSRRGFGESWWAKRWIETLESFNIGPRLSRGRSYARSGQVLSIAIEKGKVKARVQGSRPRPYDVEIAVKTLSQSDWSKVIDALGRQAIFAAKLLAGEMPRDIEPLFQTARVSLFPKSLEDLKTDCSCPDWSNPCKHIAATYYLLGDEFDRDPFLIFTLRGMSRDDLMTRLGAIGPANSVPGDSLETPAHSDEPLSVEVATFWGEAGDRIEDPCGVVEIPSEPASRLRRLGGFPFWRGTSPFLESLSPIYAAASPRGLEVVLGPERPVDRSEGERAV